MPRQTSVAPPPSPPAYEFSKTENATISRAARWARALAIMFFITTAVQVVNLNILGILVDLALGITFWKGASLLGAVVKTEKDDVPNMIGALEQLQTAFTIRIIITAIAAAIGLIVSVGFFIQYKFLHEPVEKTPAVTVEDADEEATEPEDAPAEGDPARDAPAEGAVAAEADEGSAPADETPPG